MRRIIKKELFYLAQTLHAPLLLFPPIDPWLEKENGAIVSAPFSSSIGFKFNRLLSTVFKLEHENSRVEKINVKINFSIILNIVSKFFNLV